MKSFLPYLSFRNLSRLFSRKRIVLAELADPDLEMAAMEPVPLSLTKADVNVLEHFGRLATTCFQTPAGFICSRAGKVIWQYSEYAIDIEPVKADVLVHLNHSVDSEVRLIQKPFTEVEKSKGVIQDGVARFAAFIPLRSRQGDSIGALCLLDDRERPSIREESKIRLKSLSLQMVEKLELHQQVAEFGLRHEAARSVYDFFQNQRSQAKTRDLFLADLVRHISLLARAERVFVAEVLPETPLIARTVAACFQGAGIENLDYPLAPSPFGGVARSHLCCYGRGVCKQFPNDLFLKSLGAEGFAGVTLVNVAGSVNGLIVVADRKPFENPAVVENILAAASHGVAAELESRNLDRALQSVQKRSHELFENALHGIYQLTTEDRYATANPALARMLGYASSTDLVKNVAAVSRDVYADPERRLRLISQLGTQDEAHEPGCEVIRRNGERLWISETVRVVRDVNGKLLYHEGVVEDITTRKEAEEARASSQARFQTMFEHAIPGAVLTGQTGMILQANPAFQSQLGYSVEDLASRSIADLSCSEDFKEISRLQAECLQGKRDQFRGRIRCARKDKSLVWTALEVSVVRGEDNAFQGMIGQFEDLTPYKQNEATLAETRQKLEAGSARFQTLVECADVAVAIMGQNHQFLQTNATLENLLGCAKTELSSKRLPDLIHKDDWKEYERLQTERGSDRRFQCQFEVRYLRKSGGVAWGQLTVSEVHGLGGQLQEFIAVLEDLTPRKRAEENLRASHQRFEAMFEKAAVGMALVEGNGAVSRVNPALTEMLGFSSEELLSKKLSEFSPADEARQLSKLQSECVVGKRDGFQLEMDWLRKDKSRICVRLTIAIARGADGSFHRSITMIEDITGLKRSEKAILAKDTPLQTLLEVAEHGVVFTDPKGCFTQVSPALQKLLGLSKEELISRSFTDLIHPEDREVCASLHEECLGGKRDGYHVEKRFVRKDQSIIWLRLTVSVVRHNETKPGYWVGMFEDITRRKNIEDEIRAGNERFQALLGHPGAGLAIMDPRGFLSQTNATLQNLLGYSAAELKFKSFADLTHPEDLPGFRRAQTECLEKKQSQFQVEQRCVGKQGGCLWIRLTISVTYLENGPVSMMVGMLEDVTQRKQVENALAATRETLRATERDLREKEDHLRETQAGLRSSEEKLKDTSKKLSSTGQKLDQTEKDLNVSQSRLDSTEKQLRDVEEKLRDTSAKLSTSEKTLTTTEETLQAAKLNLQGTENHLRETENSLRSSDEKLKETSEKLSSTGQKLDQTEKDLNSSRSLVDLMGKKLRDVEGKLRDTSAKLSTSEKNLTTTNETLSATKRVLQEKEEHLRKAEADFHSSEEKLRQTSEKLLAAGKKLDEGEKDLGASKNHLSLTEENLRHSEEKLHEISTKLSATENLLKTTEETLRTTERKLQEKEIHFHETEAGLHASDEKLREASEKLLAMGRQLDKTEKDLNASNSRLDFVEGKLRRSEDELHEASLRPPVGDGKSNQADQDGADDLEKKLLATEEHLRGVEEQFRAIFGQSRIGMIIMDEQGRFTEVNEALAGILGFPMGELQSKSLADISHPTDANEEISLHAECVEGKRDSYQVQKCFLNKENEVVWGQVTVSFVRSKTGAAPYAVALVENITERTIFEELIQASEKRFQALCGHTKMGVAICDPHQKISYVNPSLERMLGFSSEELQTQSITDLTHPEDAAADAKLHAECLEGTRNHYEVEKCYRHKNQEPVWTRATVTAIHGTDGAFQFTVHFLEPTLSPKSQEFGSEGKQESLPFKEQDSSRERASPISGIEGAIKRRPARRDSTLPPFASSPRSMVHAFLTLDLEDRIVLLNSKAEDLLACDHAEAFGKNLTDFYSIAHQKPVHLSADESEPATSPLPNNFALTRNWVKMRNGNQRVFLQSSSPLFDAKGDVIGKAVVCQDSKHVSQVEDELLNTDQMDSGDKLDLQIAHEFDNLLGIISILVSSFLSSLHKELNANKDDWSGSLEKARNCSRDLNETLAVLSGNSES